MRPLVGEVGEGGFVEELRVDDAAFGEVFNKQMDEFDLVGGEALAGEEAGEGLLGGGAFEVLGFGDAALQAACDSSSMTLLLKDGIP